MYSEVRKCSRCSDGELHVDVGAETDPGRFGFVCLSCGAEVELAAEGVGPGNLAMGLVAAAIVAGVMWITGVLTSRWLAVPALIFAGFAWPAVRQIRQNLRYPILRHENAAAPLDEARPTGLIDRILQFGLLAGFFMVLGFSVAWLAIWAVLGLLRGGG